MFGEVKITRVLVRFFVTSFVTIIGGEANQGIQNLREQVPGNNKVKDVGLGFMHTLVLSEN